MIDKYTIDKIIDLLPSADLKTKIKETNHKFTEDELLQIIYRYAPTFDTRLALLEQFSEIASPETSALAKAYVEYEQNNFKRFVEESDGFVYELCIKETPESAEDNYICSSYNTALICIDRYFEEYADVDAKETDKTIYKIKKRKVFSECDIFDEDAYAKCILGANKTVLEVSVYDDTTDCNSGKACSECKEICPHRYVELSFPCFAHDCAVIKYSDYEGKECFGVCLCCNSCCDNISSELYVIPLDSPTIREHRFDDVFYDHEHIELPCTTLATPDDLDETMRKYYFEFVAYLKAKA